MGFAYTPGLTVAEHTVIQKVRRLPLKGRVLVKCDQTVSAEDVVAETSLPGDVKPINVVGKLGIASEDLPTVMLKGEGDPVTAHEAFARTKGIFGFFKSEVTSPIEGTLESVSSVTGQVIIRGKPTALQKTAYARGKVVAVEPEESATVEVRGTFVQGIFGIGGRPAVRSTLSPTGPISGCTPPGLHRSIKERSWLVGGSWMRRRYSGRSRWGCAGS
jgi:hypothetical protein